SKLSSLFISFVALCSPSITPAQTDQDSLSALIKTYYAAYSQKDLGALVKLYSERSPDLVMGIQEALRTFGSDDFSFSNLALSAVRVEGNKAVFQVTATLTVTNAQTRVTRQERYVRNFAALSDRGVWRIWRDAPASQ